MEKYYLRRGIGVRVSCILSNSPRFGSFSLAPPIINHRGFKVYKCVCVLPAKILQRGLWEKIKVPVAQTMLLRMASFPKKLSKDSSSLSEQV